MIKSKNILGGFGAWLWLAITIVPIYYIVVTSLRKQSDYFTESRCRSRGIRHLVPTNWSCTTTSCVTSRTA
jgi:ABC-type glycerol-3-phosphate transport system permease component